MLNEEFKDVIINDSNLSVSNFGRVFKNGEELRQNENFDGYSVVYTGSNRSVGVHRLVAMAFIPNDNPEVKTEVNHKDFNRKNNYVDNLEWLSHSENVRYSHIHGRYKPLFGKDNPNYGNRKLSKFYKENPHIAIEKQSRKGTKNGMAKPIDVYKDGQLIKRFEYIGECCEFLHKNYGFSDNAESVRCGIRRSIKHNRPYKGFTFKK